MFYTDVKLFVDQAESDGVLDDVATMIGCTRSNLHVVASDKGLVVGRIQFDEDGDRIDCTKMGVGGKAIPPYIDKIENVVSDAEFILLVEKEAAYMRMAVRVRLVLAFWFFICERGISPRLSARRKIDSTIATPALSSPPKANPTLRRACSCLALPQNSRSQCWDWWTAIRTVSRYCRFTCRGAKI